MRIEKNGMDWRGWDGKVDQKGWEGKEESGREEMVRAGIEYEEM